MSAGSGSDQGARVTALAQTALALMRDRRLEDAARASGAGWLSVYVRIWLPLLMPSMILIGMMHFVIAAQSTSYIILLATRDTITLSLLGLEFASGGTTQREEAGIIGLIIVVMTVTIALLARRFGMGLGVQHH